MGCIVSKYLAKCRRGSGRHVKKPQDVGKEESALSEILPCVNAASVRSMKIKEGMMGR